MLAIYAVPSEFFYYSLSAGNTITFFSGTTHQVTAYYMLADATVQNKTATKPSISGDANHSKHGNSVNGTYTPQNNKMFTYPFSFFRVATPISEQDFKYENFFNASLQNAIQFRLKTCCNPEPTLLVTPLYYNGDENDYRFALSVASFPRLTIFQSTQTGEIVGKAMKNAAKAIVAIASAASGGSVGAIADTSSLIRGSNTPPLLASASPAISSGGTNDLAPQFAATGLPAANDITFEIDGYRMGLRKETAELFDNFFSRYGYAQNNVAVPNVHARTKWTYVKTRDCRCTVNAPASSLRKINDIMNNGITWWDYRTSVGNYGDFTNAVINVG